MQNGYELFHSFREIGIVGYDSSNFSLREIFCPLNLTDLTDVFKNIATIYFFFKLDNWIFFSFK